MSFSLFFLNYFLFFNTNCRGGAVVTDFRCAADVVRTPSIGKCTYLLSFWLSFFWWDTSHFVTSPFLSTRSHGLHLRWCLWRSHCYWLLWWNCVGIWSKAVAGECIFEIVLSMFWNKSWLCLMCCSIQNRLNAFCSGRYYPLMHTFASSIGTNGPMQRALNSLRMCCCFDAL